MFSQTKSIRTFATSGVSRRVAARAELPDPKAGVKNAAEGFKSDASDSLEPRVAELRDNMSTGSTNAARANEVMMFSGPVPEILNGRLAMIGFSTGLLVELYTGKNVPEQFLSNTWLVASVVLAFWLASVVPALKGSKIVDDGTGERVGGGFNFTTELINGRAAMIGFFLIIAFELITGGKMFPEVL